MARADKDYQARMKSLQLRPLRHKEGSPMMGSNGLKPFKMPDGPVRTRPMTIRKTKSIRGLTS